MGKMKGLTMNSEKDLAETTKELVKDTKELVSEQLVDEIDEQSITKVIKAVFVGIFEAVKKVY